MRYLYLILSNMMSVCFTLVFLYAWVLGAVLASGFWEKLLAIVFVPYGWYLIVEKYLVF